MTPTNTCDENQREGASDEELWSTGSDWAAGGMAACDHLQLLCRAKSLLLSHAIKCTLECNHAMHGHMARHATIHGSMRNGTSSRRACWNHDIDVPYTLLPDTQSRCPYRCIPYIFVHMCYGALSRAPPRERFGSLRRSKAILGAGGELGDLGDSPQGLCGLSVFPPPRVAVSSGQAVERNEKILDFYDENSAAQISETC